MKNYISYTITLRLLYLIIANNRDITIKKEGGD